MTTALTKAITYLLGALFLVAGLGLCTQFLYLHRISMFALVADNWINWMIITLITACGLLWVCYQKRLRIPWLLWPIGLYVLSILISGFFADDFNPLIRWQIYGFMAALLFFLTLHQWRLNDQQENNLYILLLISGLLQALLALAQTHSWSLLGHTFFPSEPLGGLYQRNRLASYLATILLVALVIKLPIVKPQNHLKSIGLQIIAAISVGLMAYILYLTASRVGFLGLFIGAIFLFVGRSITQRFYQSLLPVWLWIVAVFVGMFLASGLLTDTYANIAPLSRLSQLISSGGAGTTRSYLYQGAWQLFLESPWFGHGLGTFKTIYQNAFVAAAEPFRSIQNSVWLHPHNEVLYRLIESGIVGGLGLLIMIVAVIYKVYTTGKYKFWLYAGVLIPLTLHTQVEHPLYLNELSLCLLLVLLYLPSRFYTQSYHLNALKYANLQKISYFSIIGLTVFLLIWMGDKTAKSLPVSKAFPMVGSQTNIAYLEGLLTYSKQDSYYKHISNYLLLLHQRQTWVDNTNDKKALNNFIAQAKENEKWMKGPNLPLIQAYALARAGRFNEAYRQWSESSKRYPNHPDNQAWLTIIKSLSKDKGEGFWVTPSKP